MEKGKEGSMNGQKASDIIVSQTDEYNVYQVLSRTFEFLRISVHPGIAVVKLNLCSLKSRETGATSDSFVVEQLVKFLNEKGVIVKLVESDSASKDADLAFKYLGFKNLERRYDVKCVNLSKDDYTIKQIDGYYLKSVKVPKTMETADLFITHPKLKTHSSLKVYVTGALKNQFGCLMDRDKALHHPKIHEVIVDANLAFRPDLTIMDGIIAMTGYGPTNGTPLRLNTLIASRDPVAVDSFAARLFGYNPCSIKYIKLASSKGLGNMKYSLWGENTAIVDLLSLTEKIIVQAANLLSSIGLSAPEG
jgi:uncharacterized protein (DUF362 family)